MITVSDLQRQLYFSAGINTDVNKVWATGEKIVFPYLISNVGDGYDVSTGIFTAPFDGVYLFTCFLASHTDEIKADLVVNGMPKVGIPAIATSGSHGHFGAAGNDLPVALVSGDRVWIQYVAGSVIWTYSRAPYSTFSGYLIA